MRRSGLTVLLAASVQMSPWTTLALECPAGVPQCNGGSGTGTRIRNSQEMYSCAAGQTFPGDEFVRIYDLPGVYALSFTLTSADPDQELFLLKGCNPDLCLARGVREDHPILGPIVTLTYGGLEGPSVFVVDGQGPGSGILSYRCLDDIDIDPLDDAILFVVKTQTLQPRLLWETLAVAPYHVFRTSERTLAGFMEVGTTTVPTFDDRQAPLGPEQYYQIGQ
jgi:hypothetical protein